MQKQSEKFVFGEHGVFDIVDSDLLNVASGGTTIDPGVHQQVGGSRLDINCILIVSSCGTLEGCGALPAGFRAGNSVCYGPGNKVGNTVCVGY